MKRAALIAALAVTSALLAANLYLTYVTYARFGQITVLLVDLSSGAGEEKPVQFETPSNGIALACSKRLKCPRTTTF